LSSLTARNKIVKDFETGEVSTSNPKTIWTASQIAEFEHNQQELFNIEDKVYEQWCYETYSRRKSFERFCLI
jgi:hypothetical protein